MSHAQAAEPMGVSRVVLPLVDDGVARVPRARMHPANGPLSGGEHLGRSHGARGGTAAEHHRSGLLRVELQTIVKALRGQLD